MLNLNNNFENYLLSETKRETISWFGKDDGSYCGKFSFTPSHFYVVRWNNANSAYRVVYPLSEVNKDNELNRLAQVSKGLTNLANRRTVKTFLHPLSAVTHGYVKGLGVGAFITLAAIVSAMLIAQIALDEKQQQAIHHEAEKAIAMCSATDSLKRGDTEGVDAAIEKLQHIDPSISNPVDSSAGLPAVAVLPTLESAKQEVLAVPKLDDNDWLPPGMTKEQAETKMNNNSNAEEDGTEEWVPSEAEQVEPPAPVTYDSGDWTPQNGGQK